MPRRAGGGGPRLPTRTAIAATSILVLLAVWWIAAAVAQSRLLPTPGAVLAAGWADTRTGELPFHLAMTLMRVAGAFFVAMSVGAAIGIALGMNRTVDRFFDPWLILFLNIPALVVIVLAYLWVGLNEAAAIGAIAVNKIPNVVVTFREGARALDRPLAEMARVYRFGLADRLRHLVLPQLQPYAAAASRSGLSLIWKIALVVELLGRSNGVGFQINLYFSLSDVAAILAYTLAFVVVVLAIEFAALQPIEARATRWRAVMLDRKRPATSGGLVVEIAEKTFVSAGGTRVTAIEGLSFEAEADAFTTLIGPSGCGKTTTLRLVLGLDDDYRGTIGRPDDGARIAAVFQEPRLLPWRDVETNIRLALPRALRGRDLAPLLGTLGLSGMERHYPGELSLGLARRAALARAFAVEPALLLLDEPFVSLDEETATRLRALLVAVWSARPTTVLMVTHNLREAVELSDRIVFLAPRPARLRGVFDLGTPRDRRDAPWRAATLAELDGLYPGVL